MARGHNLSTFASFCIQRGENSDDADNKDIVHGVC